MPGTATIAALLISAVVATVAVRRSGWQVVAILLALHLCAGLGMVLVATWYWFNVMGVFIWALRNG